MHEVLNKFINVEDGQIQVSLFKRKAGWHDKHLVFSYLHVKQILSHWKHLFFYKNLPEGQSQV